MGRGKGGWWDGTDYKDGAHALGLRNKEVFTPLPNGKRLENPIQVEKIENDFIGGSDSTGRRSHLPCFL